MHWSYHIMIDSQLSRSLYIFKNNSFYEFMDAWQSQIFEIWVIHLLEIHWNEQFRWNVSFFWYLLEKLIKNIWSVLLKQILRLTYLILFKEVWVQIVSFFMDFLVLMESWGWVSMQKDIIILNSKALVFIIHFHIMISEICVLVLI